MQDIFNRAKIDSFTLLIPAELVNVISETFLQSYSKYYENSAMLEDSENFYNNYEKTENPELKTFLKYKKINRIWNGEQKTFIQIMITSKLLGKDYFQGINKQNIKSIYNYIINDSVIEIPYKDFLNSAITDIDICIDFQADLEQFEDIKKKLIDNALEEKKDVINTRKKGYKEVFGVQYNDRTKATPSKPFAKLYYKTLELTERSKDFYQCNLEPYYEQIVRNGIGRLEVTIKNSKHKERLKLTKVKTLKDLLSIKQDNLNNVHRKVITEYYQKNLNPSERKKIDSLSYNDFIALNSIKEIIKYNKKITSAELVLINQRDCNDKYKRNKIKRKVLELLEVIQSDRINKNDSEQSKSIEVLKMLGIFE